MKPLFKAVNIEKLVKAEWNYKQDNVSLIEKLKENIKRNGQVENIIVRKLEDGFYEVINGNHRLDALKQLNYKEVQVCDLDKITDKQAHRIAIETNETKFQSNQDDLSSLLKGISEEVNITLEDMAITMPYTEDELQALINGTTTPTEPKIKINQQNQQHQANKQNQQHQANQANQAHGEKYFYPKIRMSHEVAEKFLAALDALKQALYKESRDIIPGHYDVPINFILDNIEL